MDDVGRLFPERSTGGPGSFLTDPGVGLLAQLVNRWEVVAIER